MSIINEYYSKIFYFQRKYDINGIINEYYYLMNIINEYY